MEVESHGFVPGKDENGRSLWVAMVYHAPEGRQEEWYIEVSPQRCDGELELDTDSGSALVPYRSVEIPGGIDEALSFLAQRGPVLKKAHEMWRDARDGAGE